MFSLSLSKLPATRILILFCMGILMVNFLDSIVTNFVLSIIYTTITLLYITFEYIYRKKFISVYRYSSLVMYSLLIFITGLSLTSYQKNRPASFEEELLHTYLWETLEFQGTIHEVRNSIKSSSADIVTTHVLTNDSLDLRANFKLKVRFDTLHALSAGDQIRFAGTLIQPGSKKNPHEFDYKTYLEKQGFTAQVGSASLVRIVNRAPASSLFHIRNSILAKIDALFGDNTAPIAKALLMGHKLDLDKESKQSFSRAGLSHLMAVSGLHVGFIIAPLWLLITYTWSFKYGRHIGFATLLLVLYLYSSLTGFTPSVVRASLTASLIIFAKLFYKSRNSINLTSFAALALLLYNPMDLFNISFQLSFGAVYIILFAMPVVQSYLPSHLQHKWYSPLLMVVLVSIVVQIGLFPMQVYYFNEVSLISPLSNALFVPVIGLLVPLAILCTGLSFISLPTAIVLNIPADFVLSLLNDYAYMISSNSWSWVRIHSISPELFITWILGLGCLSTLRNPGIRKHCVLFFCISITLSFLLNSARSATIPELKVTVFDVGQGDATLIQTPAGKNILIDAGRWTPTYNSGRSVILPHLQAEGITKLDALFLTHPHSDHIGGILELIYEIPIDHIYNSGFEYESKLYNKYISLAAEKEIPVIKLSSGERVDIDPAVLILIYSPNQHISSSDPNEHSLIMELVYGKTEFLFTGDAEHIAEEHALMNFDTLLNADVLKVGHHGSRTSSTQPFIDIVDPKYAVVSLADRNFFGHPHKETLNRFKASNIEPLFTSKEGALVFVSNGEIVMRKEWH